MLLILYTVVLGRFVSCLNMLCVVGSGPSAFYTAQYILKKVVNINIDMIERLPYPFGLVRYGVAPDHQSAKNVINKFETTMEDPRLSFLGNINIGKDVPLTNLLDAYDAVILCYGSFNKQNINIPGENLSGVFSAQSFVGWYNGHPDHKDFKPNLDAESVVIIGMGNVSLDIARILLTPHQLLQPTDISENALANLARKKTRHVVLTGRRGPMEAAYTIKEFRKITNIPECQLILNPHDFHSLETGDLPRPKARLKDLYNSLLQKQNSSEPANSLDGMGNVIEFRFCLKPKGIMGHESQFVSGVKFEKTNMPELQKAEERNGDGRLVDIPCGMVIKSIGFKGQDLDPSFPLVDSSGIIPNERGRVIGHKGLYCSGWIKTGSVGDISTTMYDAYETAQSLIEDLNSTPTNPCHHKEKGGIRKLISENDLKVTTWHDWKKVNQIEIERGKEKNKLREKMID